MLEREGKMQKNSHYPFGLKEYGASNLVILEKNKHKKYIVVEKSKISLGKNDFLQKMQILPNGKIYVEMECAQNHERYSRVIVLDGQKE